MNAIAKVRPMVEGSALSSDEWCTPKWLCELLLDFDLDPCSNERSSVSARDICRLDCGQDGIVEEWGERSVFCNPSYSNVRPWAAKLADHAGPWCALLKLDPTTKWWATLMSANPTVAPFRKRIKFDGDKAMTANFPSSLVYRSWSPSRDLEQHLWLRRWA